MTTLRQATFTRMGQGTRKLWVLRVEGGEAPKPGDRLEVLKRDGTAEEKVVLKCVWKSLPGSGQPANPGVEGPSTRPVYLCTFLGKRDSRMLELARTLIDYDADMAISIHVDAKELAKLVLEKLTPKEGREEPSP